MEARDLTADERHVLFGLVGRLAGADGVIAHGEVEEIEALGEEIGCDPQAAIAAANERFPNLDGLMEAAANLEREEARQLLRTLLIDLASSDGDRGVEENALLSKVTRLWAKS